MNTVFVILPCYNEQDNIEILIDKWYIEQKKIYDKGYLLKIIAIDDKSNDNTKGIIKKLVIQHKEIFPIYFPENMGLGGGLFYGLKYFALESNDGDIAVVMDADNTHNPQYIFVMIDRIISGYDCVIASRYCKCSHIKGITTDRSLLTLCAKLYYQLILGIPKIKDYTCGFRAYSSSIIKKAHKIYSDKLVEEKSFACMMELLYKLYLIDAKISEIPFELRYDLKKGKSKMRIIATIKSSLLTAIRLRLYTKEKHSDYY